jgi:hypothetical protein
MTDAVSLLRAAAHAMDTNGIERLAPTRIKHRCASRVYEQWPLARIYDPLASWKI